MKATPGKYLNPYLAGFLLGLVLLLSYYLAGRGLGASGAVKSVVVSAIDATNPAHAQSSAFYGKYVGDDKNPLNSWLVYVALGVLIGGFVSGKISRRLGFKLEKGPNITNKKRIVFAVIGGVLFGLGAQFGRGCTSGSALSGMAVLSTAGFVSMMAIFGTGFILAYFFRKLWI